MAAAPSLAAGTSLNPPPNRPMGVRAPSTMTDEVMTALLSKTPGHCREGGRTGRSETLLDAGGRRRERGRMRGRLSAVDGDRLLGEVEGRTVGLGPGGQRGPDDLEDLLAHELVPLEEGIAQGHHEVPVRPKDPRDAFLLLVQERLDALLRVPIGQHLPHEVA